jgi:hypothetical protein
LRAERNCTKTKQHGEHQRSGNGLQHRHLLLVSGQIVNWGRGDEPFDADNCD